MSSTDEEPDRMQETIVDKATWGDMMREFRQMVKEEIESTKLNVEKNSKDIQELRKENSELKKEVESLKAYIKKSERKEEIFDKFTRKKNLIFKGFEKDKIEKSDVWDLCKNVLKIELKPEISRIIKIGKHNKKTFLVEFENQSSVTAILQSTSKLVNSNIGVQRDLTENERNIQNFLLRVRNDIRKIDRTKDVKFKGNRIEIEGKIFTVEQGELKNGEKPAKEVLEQLYNKDFENVVLAMQDKSE